MEKLKNVRARFIVGAILLGTAAFIGFTFVLMWLWNWLMPDIFSLGEITFWQAAGLLLLSKILFSGGGHAHQMHSDRKKKFWHRRLEEKWKHIPEEKKSEFIQKMKEKGFNKPSEEEPETQN